ncbi:MAG: glycerol-3-phosphate acyltransferase [Bacteroidota bacterium]
MDYLEILFCTIIAYLIGSFPSSILLSKLIYGIDIREHGRGNASHVNVHQILGVRPGILVQGIDILKGVIAARVALFVHNQYGFFSEFEYPILMMTFGLAALLGHIFPIFAGYRGGKGYHVTLGILIAIHPLATTVFVLFTIGIFLISRYQHLAYVAGAVALSLYVLINGQAFGEYILPMQIFTICFSLMLLVTHRRELRGIFQGTEHRTHLNFLRDRSVREK